MNTASSLGDNTGPGPEEGLDFETAIRDLAQFRYGLRKFVRFSESAARRCGITPQQHQLMLGVAGFTGRSCATVSELAEFLQEKNHSVVGLVERAVESGLVRRTQGSADRRVVVVYLTRRGEALLKRLTRLHQKEIGRIPFVEIAAAQQKKSPALRKGATASNGAGRKSAAKA